MRTSITQQVDQDQEEEAGLRFLSDGTMVAATSALPGVAVDTLVWGYDGVASVQIGGKFKIPENTGSTSLPLERMRSLIFKFTALFYSVQLLGPLFRLLTSSNSFGANLIQY